MVKFLAIVFLAIIDIIIFVLRVVCSLVLWVDFVEEFSYKNSEGEICVLFALTNKYIDKQ